MSDGIQDPTLALYSTLKYAYDFFNRELFENQLKNGVITFHRQRKVMGYASHRRWKNRDGAYVDEIAINPEYFEDYPLVEICQTLCHEMVHLWQAHHGKPGRRGYHNTEWAEKMQAIGLMPSSTGQPGGDRTGEQMMDYVIADGPFVLACQILLDKGYDFPWFDCFPVIRKKLPVYSYKLDSTPIELTEKLKPKRVVSRPLTIDSPEIGTSFLIENSEITDLTAPNQDNLVFHSTRSPSSSGRVKYTCKVCQTNVWGKPGLNIGCLDCNSKLFLSE